MNFQTVYEDGKAGKNFGWTTGIKALDKAINGLQRKMSIGIAAAPKCGKTKLTDFCCIIMPYLQALALGKVDNLEWIYFSYEIDRVSKEFNFVAFFMYHDYGIFDFKYKDKTYGMSATYLMGQQIHENEDGTTEYIRVFDEHEEKIKSIFINRIVPLFGKFDANGKQIQAGKIIFFEEPENPTGLNKYLFSHAQKNGKFLQEEYETVGDDGVTKVKRFRTIGYTPNNAEKTTFVITDHIRKLRRERGFSMKENIDKWLEYSTKFRNLTYYTFIHVIHSNRSLANPERLRVAGEWIFPTADDCKDSGNPAEECTVFMTMFNPNDEKYNLDRHFGHVLENYPKYRSIHITESRNTECPAHIFTNMYGGVGAFEPLIN